MEEQDDRGFAPNPKRASGEEGSAPAPPPAPHRYPMGHVPPGATPTLPYRYPMGHKIAPAPAAAQSPPEDGSSFGPPSEEVGEATREAHEASCMAYGAWKSAQAETRRMREKSEQGWVDAARANWLVEEGAARGSDNVDTLEATFEEKWTDMHRTHAAYIAAKEAEQAAWAKSERAFAAWTDADFEYRQKMRKRKYER